MDKRYISASEIGLYLFCPRAWALKRLDYEPDNRWELEKGKEYHEEIGLQKLRVNAESIPEQNRLERQVKFLRIVVIMLILVIFSVLIRLLLK